MSFARKSLIAATTTAAIATGAFAPAFAEEGSTDANLTGGTNGTVQSSGSSEAVAELGGNLGGEGNATASSDAVTGHTEAGVEGQGTAELNGSSDAVAEIGADSNSSQRIEGTAKADEATSSSSSDEQAEAEEAADSSEGSTAAIAESSDSELSTEENLNTGVKVIKVIGKIVGFFSPVVAGMNVFSS